MVFNWIYNDWFIKFGIIMVFEILIEIECIWVYWFIYLIKKSKIFVKCYFNWMEGSRI